MHNDSLARVGVDKRRSLGAGVPLVASSPTAAGANGATAVTAVTAATAVTERRWDLVTERPDGPEATSELNVGMDPEYVDFFVALLPQVVAVTRRITGDLAAAEDAASEALAKAYLRWPKLRHLAYREAWVLRVASNEALGTIRKQARRERILRRQPMLPTVVDDGEEGRQVLVDQIRRLPNRQRQVVTLRFYADLPVAEVAATLGISAGAVKSHLHRALHTLSERIGTDILGGNLE